MGKLLYSAIASLDGYIADETGNFTWAEPDQEVHAFINDLDRPLGTYLYGRRTYEVMAAWERLPLDDQPQYMRDFAHVWREADKVVFSRTLERVGTRRTRLEREFVPESIVHLKEREARDITIAGPNLAAHAFRAGLIDECHLFLAPIIVGGGTRSLPAGVRQQLELIGQRRFSQGMSYLHYRRGGSNE